MKKIFLILVALLLLLTADLFGQNAFLAGNGTATASLVVSSQPCKITKIFGYNTNAANLFIHVFQSGTVPANTTVPLFIIPAPSQQLYQFDFGAFGVDLDSCSIAFSTTTNSLTIAAASGNIAAIYQRLR